MAVLLEAVPSESDQQSELKVRMTLILTKKLTYKCSRSKLGIIFKLSPPPSARPLCRLHRAEPVCRPVPFQALPTEEHGMFVFKLNHHQSPILIFVISANITHITQSQRMTAK